MFHDPVLDRTTNGTGRIDKQPWHGVLESVIDFLFEVIC